MRDNISVEIKINYKSNFKLISPSNVGSVVEFSPATREARVRFPDVASFWLITAFFTADTHSTMPGSFFRLHNSSVPRSKILRVKCNASLVRLNRLEAKIWRFQFQLLLKTLLTLSLTLHLTSELLRFLSTELLILSEYFEDLWRS